MFIEDTIGRDVYRQLYRQGFEEHPTEGKRLELLERMIAELETD